MKPLLVSTPPHDLLGGLGRYGARERRVEQVLFHARLPP
jgi:hypothetical protein